MREAKAELVRIDSQGAAHPIGSVASQRMRLRKGEYRLLPAPPHVVFMRYTGEDGRRDEGDGAIVRVAGEISAPGAVNDVLAMLAQSGARGELIVFEGEDARSLYFDKGSIVGVRTSVEREHLGMVLYAYGAVTLDQHERIMQRVRRGERYGESAIALGFVAGEDIYRHLGRQVAEVAFACMLVADGTFFFLDGFDEQSLPSRHTISASLLLMDGVTRMDEVKYFRTRIPSPEYVPARLQHAKSPPSELLDVYQAIDGTRTVEQIGRLTGKGEFEATKQVYSLTQSKHVEVRTPPMAGGVRAVVETANAILLRLHQAAEERQVADALRKDLDRFTVGAGVHGILFRGAGPDARGVFEPETVVANLNLIESGSSAIEMAKQLIEQYVGFALFTAESLLPTAQSQDLKLQIAELLSALRPSASGA